MPGRGRAAVAIWLCGIAMAVAGPGVAAVLAEAPEWKWTLDLRLRAEAFDTPAANAAVDPTYDFTVGRARAGAEVSWREVFALRGVVQAAGTTTLPENAAFGAGLNLFNTNRPDRSPSQIGVAELLFLWKAERFTLGLGRQGFVEGAGPATGVAHLDFVRTRRLAERLVGNLEFANIARRFDGATLLGKPGEAGSFELFALRPLGGALNYEQAFDPLEIDVLGVAWASRHGQLLPASSLRLFAQSYRDERAVALQSAGGRVEIGTFGASLLSGGPKWNAMIWGAIQRGDFGSTDHSAWAMLVDLGWRFVEILGEPSIHLGWEHASGGGQQGENRNFWNVLPTNHKFYGALDYFAFSNLSDLFVELRWSPTKSIAVLAAVHDFRLADRSGPWVSGSGPFSDRELGYASRRPASGRYESSALGRELDASITWTLPRGFALKLEGGLFQGGAAAEQVLPVESDGSWVALEATFKR